MLQFINVILRLIKYLKYLTPPDPGYIYTTTDLNVFVNWIAALRAGGGGDCREPSIGALIRAMNASEPDSSIYVFTDASANDEHLLPMAERLINKKQIKVTYVIQNGCGYTRKQRDKRYPIHIST